MNADPDMRSNAGEAAMLGAEALLRSLRTNGVDYLFANAGSDFAPVIEAMAAVRDATAIPDTITVAHENAAVAMAHGYFLATGRAQAAMVHVNVGLANAVMGLINAHSDDVPVMMLSGRTPLTEHDRPGARVSPIQYGQEQFDQAGMVRDVVKWQYELRYGDQAADLVSRAYSVAMSDPKGAIYLSLPREPLCEPAPVPRAPIQTPARAAVADPAQIDRVAALLDGAQTPLIICSRGDPQGRVADAMATLAGRYGAPVAEMFVTRNVMPSRHPAMIGPALAKALPDADVVLVVDTPVAWIESKVRPGPQSTVIHIGADPLFRRLPVRSYKTDIAIAGDTASALEAIAARIAPRPLGDRTAALHRAFRRGIENAWAEGSAGTPTKAYVAKCLSDVLGANGIVVSERGAPAPYFDLAAGNRFFGNTQAGGLGWAMPAALGAQLADRARLVACVVGDGAYMFANPVACHQIAEANELPIMTVIVNNDAWDAVRTSTLAVFPEGEAARANRMPMVAIPKGPDYAMIARASRAATFRVAQAEHLAKTFGQAAALIRKERRQVLVDVAVRPD